MNHIENMEELIRKEVQSINSLEERVAFKQLMEQVFLSIYETNEQMYADLEKRVQDELSYDVNHYLVRTGVIERKYFDASHHMVSPMEESDLKVPSYQMKDIIKSIDCNGSFSLMKVLLRCDYTQLQDLWNEEIEFHGEIETEQPDKMWEITVVLRPNTEYLKKIGHLYQLFIKNGIPWQTVNAPYLYKMANVILCQLPEGIQESEAIKKVQINFEKYNQIIIHDFIPIWNIKRLTLDGIGFPVPCEDHKSYEHAISIREHGIQHAYLVEDDIEIQSVSQQKEKLLIVSRTNVAKKWNVYMIRNAVDSQIDHYTYPIMLNQRAETFSEKFHKKWNASIKTRVELARFIKGFGLEDYIIYKDCEIKEQFEKGKETYSMNLFIDDEIRDSRAQKKLILYFKSGGREAWLQRDIASFIVSEVQRIYPEYECGGIVL